ncbi:MAG: hypothetical protein ACP5MZ_04355 [Candidatus Micrarchaeia archaeon]
MRRKEVDGKPVLYCPACNETVETNKVEDLKIVFPARPRRTILMPQAKDAEESENHKERNKS